MGVRIVSTSRGSLDDYVGKVLRIAFGKPSSQTWQECGGRFPGGASGEEPTCQRETTASIPELGDRLE